MIHLLWSPTRMRRDSTSHATRRRRDRRAGFSLIELLTVIAIIAILAALIFPAAGSVRRRAQMSQVISNLHAVQTSLGIYKLDEHGYPPTLGPAIFQQSSSQGNTTTEVNGLFPEYLKDKGAYTSPASDIQNPELSYPVSLPASQKPGGAYFGMVGSPPGTINDPILSSKGAMMYGWDTMDGHVFQGTGSSTPVYVMHYSRYRTFDRNDPDYKRQLGFRNPPEDTVVTWNDTFVQKDGNDVPLSGDYLVLFLNGTVKKFSVAQAKAVNLQIWRLTP